MDTNKGGCCLNPLNTPQEIQNLPQLDPSNFILTSFYQTIFLTRLALKGQAAVIGYSGSPWTIFVYLVEKSKNGLLESSKKWINTYIDQSVELLEKITEGLFIHIIEQIKAGAQIIQLFDVFSDALTPDDFSQFAWKFLLNLVDKIKFVNKNVPIVLYARGQTAFLKKKLQEEEKLGFDGFAFDQNCDLEEMALLCEERKVTLVGNLDPGVLMGSMKIIEQKTIGMMKKGKKCSRFIANVGQGLIEEIDPKNVEVFVETIRKYKSN